MKPSSLMPELKPEYKERNRVLEKKILLRYIPAAALVALLYGSYDLAAGDDDSLIKAFTAIGMFSACYLAIYFTNCSVVAKRSVLAFFILIVSSGFFFQGGLRGINAFDFFNLAMVLGMVTSGWEKRTFLSIASLAFCALAWVEINHESWIVEHEMHHPVWFDIVEISCRILTTFYAGYLYKKEFNMERAKVFTMNAELTQAHGEIVAYNQQLKRAVAELREQKSKIESINTELIYERAQTLDSNKKLAEANEEIETKNEQILEYNRMLERMLEELKEEQQKVLEVNQELEQMNAELNANNEYVAALNETLERKVIERTEGIAEMNKKMAQYAFFTSHEMRGPLARILGLTHLMAHDFKSCNGKGNHDQLLMYIDKLLISASELDHQIRRASVLLNEVEIDQLT